MGGLAVGASLGALDGASLGALLAAQGVPLPVTLAFDDGGGEREAAAAATAFAQLQRALAGMRNANGAAARAVDEWLAGRSAEEGELVAEALSCTSQDGVRVYANLAQAADELTAMACEL